MTTSWINEKKSLWRKLRLQLKLKVNKMSTDIARKLFSDRRLECEQKSRRKRRVFLCVCV